MKVGEQQLNELEQVVFKLSGAKTRLEAIMSTEEKRLDRLMQLHKNVESKCEKVRELLSNAEKKVNDGELIPT